MTLYEWRSLVRKIKNKGEFHMLTCAVSYYFKHNNISYDIKKFYKQYGYNVILKWYHDAYEIAMKEI